MSEAALPSDSSRNRLLFFALLALGTLTPLALMPLLAHWGRGTSATSITNIMVFLGANGHVATTLFFYTDRALFEYFRERRGRYLVAPAALVLATGVLYQSASPSYTFHILLFYFSWQTYHYMRQNYGILAFVASATRTGPPHWLERVSLNVGVLGGILGMVRLMGLHEGTVANGYENLLYFAGLVACVMAPAFALAAVAVHSPLRHSPARVFFLGLTAIFYLPTFVFSDVPSAILGYALAHGFQYFVFMAFVSGNRRSRPDLTGLSIVAGSCLAGGAVLLLMSEEALWGAWGRFVFGCYLGAVMSHFVVDAGIWRLRDAFPRKYLSESFDFILAPRGGS